MNWYLAFVGLLALLITVYAWKRSRVFEPPGDPRRMISMKQWEDTRLRCVRDREHIKRVARDLGISSNTVRKYVRQMEAPKPPRYERRSKLDPFVTVIDGLLESTPKITAKRIGTILGQQYDATALSRAHPR